MTEATLVHMMEIKPASKWRLWLVKTFGKKLTGRDGDVVVTMYLYGNMFYVEKVERE